MRRAQHDMSEGTRSPAGFRGGEWCPPTVVCLKSWPRNHKQWNLNATLKHSSAGLQIVSDPSVVSGLWSMSLGMVRSSSTQNSDENSGSQESRLVALCIAWRRGRSASYRLPATPLRRPAYFSFRIDCKLLPCFSNCCKTRNYSGHRLRFLRRLSWSYTWR